jgi:hypothetical protein
MEKQEIVKLSFKKRIKIMCSNFVGGINNLYIYI